MPVGRCKAPPRRIEAPCMRRVNQPRRCSRILRTFPVPAARWVRCPPMRRLDARLEGPILLAPDVFGDDRGFFCETYRRSSFMEHGIHEEMVQDNHSRSRRGVVRGMHFTVGARRGQARALRPRDDLRRRSWTCAGLAHLRGLGGLRAERREHAHPLRPRRLRPWLLRHQRGRRRPLQAGRLLRPGADHAHQVRRSRDRHRWPMPLDELQPSQRDVDAPLLRDVGTICRSCTADRHRHRAAQNEQGHIVALLAVLEGLQRVVDPRGHLVGVERRGARRAAR